MVRLKKMISIHTHSFIHTIIFKIDQYFFLNRKPILVKKYLMNQNIELKLFVVRERDKGDQRLTLNC